MAKAPAFDAADRGSVRPPHTESPPLRVRLTRRGRRVFAGLGAVIVGVVLATAAVSFTPPAYAESDGERSEFSYVIVAPGGSLWDVATALDTSIDPRDLVSEIVRLNQLGGSGVQAGQPIAVPLRYADAPGVVSASELGIDL